MPGMVNIRELSKIIQISEIAIYNIIGNKGEYESVKEYQESHSKIDFKKTNGRNLVDMNVFVKNHMIYPFEEYDFYGDIEKYIEKDEYLDQCDEYITTTTLTLVYNMNRYQIEKMKKSNCVAVLLDETQKRKKFLYNKANVIDYINGLINETPELEDIFKPKAALKIRDIHALFLKPSELRGYLWANDIILSESTINRRILKDGKIPAIRLGRQIRIPVALIESMSMNQLKKLQISE